MPIERSMTRPESEYRYYDKSKQRVVRFRPHGTEVLATLRRRNAQTNEELEIAEKAILQTVRDSGLSLSRPASPELGVVVLQVPATLTVEAALEKARGSNEVANAIPVLLDEEGNRRFLLPDELTVQFRRDLPTQQAEQIIADRASTILVRQRTAGYYTISVPRDRGLFETIDAFNRLPEVEFAEGSEMGFDDALAYDPADPEFPNLWGLHNTGQTGGTPNADINAPEAWDLQRGNPDVIVAVIDTGADLTHPDLVANFLPQGSEDWDFSSLASVIPQDTQGHGTHVSGTVAAVDNAIGVVGVAHLCRLMPLKVDLTAGMNANRADAINYVTDQALAHPNRRYIINGSWRMSSNMTAVETAIRRAAQDGVVLVFAAGNDFGGPVTYPARYPETIAVANTDHNDRISASSSVGPEVDVCAPGTQIRSTTLGGGYGNMTGTSMASPHAAGVAALIWSRNMRLTNAEVRKILEDTCDDISLVNPTMAGQIGRGRINAYQALLQTSLPATLVRSFPFPQANNGNGTGLAFAASFPFPGAPRPALLFLTQKPLSECVYFLDPLTGATLGSILPVGHNTIASLEWDGQSILVAKVNPNGYIIKIDPRTGQGVQQVWVPSGAGHGLGLILSQNRLFYSTVSTIHVFDLTTFASLNHFPAPGGACYSLAADAKYLYCGTATPGLIVVYDVAAACAIGHLTVPGSTAPRSVEGLALDPATRELYVANPTVNTISVLKLDF